ncbi:MAG: hypothetical protein Aurels2KO_17140 [Aureliella sp.]
MWDKRENWASFAGDSSLTALRGLFPKLPVVLTCAALLILVAAYYRLQGKDLAAFRRPKEVLLWTVAFLGPVVAVWILTRLEIAPLMHRRYVVASLAPLALVAATLTSCLPNRAARTLAVCLLLGGLLVQQGTPAELRRGRLTPWQRLEGWRQASKHINANCQPTDAVWCASQLIEGNTKELSLDDALDQYLAYPLRGIYGPSKIPQSQVHALVNDPQRWADQIFLPLESNPAKLSASNAHTIWIVYRGIARDLNRRIAVVSSKPQAIQYRITITSAARSFGNISVVRIEAEKRITR